MHNEKETVTKASLLYRNIIITFFPLSGAPITFLSRPVGLQMVQYHVTDHKLHSTALWPTLSRQDSTTTRVWPIAELSQCLSIGQIFIKKHYDVGLMKLQVCKAS